MSFLVLEADGMNDQFKVCRVCLAMDVKMHNLQRPPLETYFESIIGIPVMSTMELPMFLCFECAGLVRKFSLFKERCLRGQATLFGLLQNDVKLSQQVINQVNRNKSLLNSPHVSTDIVTIQYNPFDDNSTETQTIENHKVKEEPIIPQDETDQYTKHDSLDDIPSPKLYDAFQDVENSSDDEPLSVHKTNKVKKKKKKKQIEESDNNLSENFGDNSLISEPEPKPELIVIRKRGRPKKSDVMEKKPTKTIAKSRRTANTGGVHNDDIDLEEYVTIVQLTLEQQLEEINKRKESDNYTNAPFKCGLCYRGFIDTNAWNHHVKKHDPSAGDVECEICKFRFPTKRALQKHASNHEKKFACKACSYVSKTAYNEECMYLFFSTQAKQHQRWHKGVVYKCEYCNEVSTKWTSYLSHVRMKHPSQHICGVCGYSFVSQLGLNMHKTMMHKDVVETSGEGVQESGPYCEECDVKFVSLEAYNRHMVTSVKHSAANNFNRGCRVCGATFPSAEELRLHHRKQHPRARPKNYGKKPSSLSWPAQCEHCSEEISNARDYWTHFRRAHPDLPYPIRKDYVCDICGKAFRGNAFLTYHKRTHSSERLFSCGTCGKSFYNRTNLGMHERTHSDVRPHACDLCCKAFKSKGALDRHYRSHTGVKPYECEVCGKAFGQSNSRKLHVRTVHLKQPAPYVSKARLERKKPVKESNLDQAMYVTDKQNDKEVQPQSNYLMGKQSVVYSLPLSQVTHVITP